ncbi:MAG: hypothetical protein LUQ65_07380 [Candidatus Helarchaeota archaeon]|nr:hypothetical protein [Candidatus Helarchaeota archaeon]
MSNRKKNYVTARQIDGRSGIQTPHERELESIGKNKLKIFTAMPPETIKTFIETRLNGKIENIEFGEQYTVSFEYFPAVNIHILYFNYEAEESEPMGGPELKFLFSGERVMWVPSEDLNSFIDVALEYLEDLTDSKTEPYNIAKDKTSLLKNAITQRTEPFLTLEPAHLNDLATFIGGQVEQTSTGWALSKPFFPGIEIHLLYNYNTRNLDIQYSGVHVQNINHYARDLLSIFLINHCLRFISITYPTIQMPRIIKQVFSYSYLKSHSQ